jgi:hypothetical protein
MRRRLVENLALRYQGLMLLLFPRTAAEGFAKALYPLLKKQEILDERRGGRR